jgi:hypothetical protein
MVTLFGEVQIMQEKTKIKYKGVERRSEPRSIADQYSRVEFSIGNLGPAYLFNIWNTSLAGMGVLVKEGSDVLNHLKVGDVVDMKYYPLKSSEQPEYLRTEIKYITKDDRGQFKGHYLVGLSVLEKQRGNP